MGVDFMAFCGDLNSKFSAVRARAINDRHALPDDVASQSKQPDTLLPFKRNELAAGSGDHQPIDLLMSNKPIPVPSGSFLIQIVLLIHHVQATTEYPPKPLPINRHQ